MNLPVTITKLCLECDNPAVTVPLVTDRTLTLWCNYHLLIACDASITRLGRDTHDFIFSVIPHDVWFWEIDISNALQAALETFFEGVAQNLYNVETSVYGLEELIRVKAKELRGVIQFSQQKRHDIEKIMRVWLTPGYIDDIDGPLGKNTSDVMRVVARNLISSETAEILTCMTLSAKRAASYEGRNNCAVLVKVERNIWQSHKTTLGAING
ncbi:MAG TPA: hypothetical protein ENI27_04970 [bacterium]|nr:hypothetical protein [bacterium]